MKTVKVVAALILDRGCVMATQRNSGEFAGGWEFPGGKVESGETQEDALRREIFEELELVVREIKFFKNVQHQYETFFLNMDCFTCEIESGNLRLNNHSSVRWLDAQTLDDVDWLPADVDLVENLKELLSAPIDV